LYRWCRCRRSRLQERRLAVLEERIAIDLDLGRHRDLVGELEPLVARHPLRERLRAQLMLALYRCRRQAEALERYRAGRAFLAQELGLAPAEELQRLEQAILRQDPSLQLQPAEGDAGRPDRRTPDAPPDPERRPRGVRARYPVAAAALVGLASVAAVLVLRAERDPDPITANP
jgi:DNA-binding SARP family transcriptional activator